MFYRADAPKKATNVFINADLLAQARELSINLSRTLEAALADVVASRARELWLEQNHEAMAMYNARVDESGVFGDDVRLF